MKTHLTAALLLAACATLSAQKVWKAPARYKPVRTEIYHKGWIDFNKNGQKDIYEDPSAPIDARIEDLLSQMTTDEKTCQMVTLYGYKRVLKDDLPNPSWKEKLWKDGIGAIDEHLNGFQQWGLPPSDNENVWPASRHAWALNEVQRFFVEETRLGIPTDFTNEGIRGIESYRATNFPTQLGLGHTWNRDLIHYGPLAVEVTSVLQGIREKTRDHCQVLYTKGCDLVDAHWPESELIDYPLTADEQQEIDRAVAHARQADVAVVVLGGGQRTCGENKSRSSLDLPGRQLHLLKAVAATGKPVVLVLINGRPLSINWADKFVPAILEAWYPGSKGGIAVADALFGHYNPGGKLTVTFPKSVGQIPFNFPSKPSAQIDGGRKEGPDGNMSRVNGPLYPFGYGLSYTTFAYSDLKLSSSTITPHQSVTATCRVTNTGQRAGDEVVQLYVRDVLSSVTTYEKRLAGFERIHLQPGETREVTFTLGRQALELLNADMHWVVEPGDFTLMVGASSEDIRLTGTLTVTDPLQPSTARTSRSQSPVSASTNTEQTAYVLDGDPLTRWEGNKGDYLTFVLQPDAKISQLTVTFHNDNPVEANFEIQLSSGGGQFLTVYTGTTRQYGEPLTFSFKESVASDLRIVLESDRVGISEVKLPQLRK